MLGAAGDVAKWICIGISVAVALLFAYAIVMIVIGTFFSPRLPKTTVYDKVKYYADLHEGDSGYIPVGMLFGWLIDSGLASEEVHFETKEEVERFKARELTGPDLYELWDGVLVDDMLTDQGNRFLKWYMDRFYGDFAETLCGAEEFDEHCYAVEDTWENYDRLKTILDARLASWKERSEQNG